MAELNIYGQIGHFNGVKGLTSIEFAQQLAEIDPSEDLSLYMSSPGGVIREGLTMYSDLARRPGMVNIHIHGVVGSIASVMAMAGDTITMAQSAKLMIHNPMGPSALAFGDSDTLREAAEHNIRTAEVLDGMRDETADVYAARTGSSRAQIVEWMAEETWFNAADAKKHGFADAIAPNKQLVAHTTSDTPFAAPIADENELLAVQDLIANLPIRNRQRASEGAYRMAQAKLQLTTL